MPSFGTLKADTLTHSTAGSLATNFVVKGGAKHHLHLNGSDHSVLDSLNNSSTTDDGSGLATLAVTNSFTNANYTYTASRNGSTNNTFIFTIETPSRTSSTMSISTKLTSTSSITLGDANSFSCSILGDLA